MPLQVINGIGRVGIRSASPAVSAFDADAQAFITATALTDTTQKNAINDLVLDLKAAGVWTKLKAIYPMIGGTATTHKFNLKNPTDSDAAFRLQFNGGWTHSATGALPNGTTGYANTFLTPNTNLTSNNIGLSYYSGTNNLSGFRTDIGVANNTPQFLKLIIAGNGYQLNVNRYGMFPYLQANTSPAQFEVFDSLGFHVTSRVSSIETTFKRGTKYTNASSTTTQGLPSTPIYIGANNNSNSSVSEFSNRQCRFASINDGLTDNESYLYYQIVEKYQYALGRNIDSTKSFYYNKNYNDETNRFIFNGGITDATQQSAVNTLVGDLKASSIWTKLKAIYPMVGGTATAHKFNLVNPVDSNAAYRLVFNGGWTHSANGALPNGTTGYADTNLIPSTVLTNNSTHMSYYSRTESNPSLATFDMGTSNGTSNAIFSLSSRVSNILYIDSYNSNTNRMATANSSSLGHFINNRATSTSLKAIKNGTQIGTTLTTTSAGFTSLGGKIYIGSLNNSNVSTPLYYSNKECAFSSIGDGLTDLESTLFYQIVEKFQYTLGRNINATQPFYYNSAYSNETNVFIFNGGITDATQQSAVNTLVTTLKTAGVWTKMKAVYPMVGGTANSHKFNLVNPVDTNEAFRLTFVGGGTHSSTGYQPNGSNAYANTNMNTSTNLISNNAHISYYMTTEPSNDSNIVFGNSENTTNYLPIIQMYPKNTNNLIVDMQDFNYRVTGPNLVSIGMYVLNRSSSNNFKVFKNSNIFGTNTGTQPQTRFPNSNLYLAAFNYAGTSVGNYSSSRCIFASIGNSLTDAEALTFYNAVQAFQTTLNRQV